jgi:hypothetical protein
MLGHRLGMSEEGPKEKDISFVAKEINRLKIATIEASKERERLPQPLFWSLFHSALADVRAAKERDRLINDLLES